MSLPPFKLFSSEEPAVHILSALTTHNIVKGLLPIPGEFRTEILVMALAATAVEQGLKEGKTPDETLEWVRSMLDHHYTDFENMKPKVLAEMRARKGQP